MEWTASELIGMLFAPSYEKKIHNWRGVIADIVLELFNRKNLTLEDLQDNEVFLSLVQQATQIAIKATQEEKREYLKNGLLNSFVNLVDELTVSHVKL